MSDDTGSAVASKAYADQIGARKAAMRETGRELTGTGGTRDRRSLHRLLRDEGLRYYPLIALFLLSSAQAFGGEANSIEGPDILRTFGLSATYLNVVMVVGQVVGLSVPLAVARYVQNRARRAQVALVSCAVYAVFVPLTGFAIVPWMILGVTIADQVTSQANATVNTSLLIDLYPPQVRVRVVAFLTAAGIAAGIIVQGLGLLLTGPANLNWRGVYLVLGVLTVLFALFSLRLRDPGYGHFDTARLRAAIRRDNDTEQSDGSRPTSVTGSPAAPDPYRLSLSEALRRIMAIRTMRMLVVAGSVSLVASPVTVYVTLYFNNKLSLSPFERALVPIAGSVAMLISWLVLAPISDRIFQRNPGMVFYINGAVGLASIPVWVLSLNATNVAQLMAFIAGSSLLSGLSGPAVTVGQMSVVPANLRPHVGAVQGIAGLVASVIGVTLFAQIAPRLGIYVAVGISAAITCVSTVFSMLAGRWIGGDLDAMVDGVVEDEAIAQWQSGGIEAPVVSLQQVDFGYGQTQVLFAVDFSVQPGEMVALLGVNGAGKSSLLRVLSGLGLPSRGTIRLHGRDITYVDAHRRTQLGITQIPGGRAVFNELTVAENLRCYAHSLGDGHRGATQRIDEAFTAFPRLRELRNRPAVVLSGGEQQMLALSKALILRPEVLLIDELSLGLAPAIVGQLLDTVRRINGNGTAVVLVEQSVNVALSIAEHVYFMEHGQVRFDGPSSEFRDRPELLRAVFLPTELMVSES